MPRQRRHRSPTLIFLALGDAMIATIFVWLALRCQWPPWLAYLSAINLATLLAYAYDKAAAHRQWMRIPEWVLHFFALVGGSPAAFFSQLLFRHKTIKRSFRTWFWIIVAVQVIAGGALVILMLRGPR